MPVFICVPAFGRQVCAETMMSLMETGRALHAHGTDYAFSTHSFPDIAELRNMMLTLWYDRLTDCDYLLMVDADMGFPAQLVVDMIEFGEPLTGCLYPKKTIPISYVGRGAPGAERLGFFEVEGVGAGVMLVRRSCVTAMLDGGAARSDDRLDHHSAGPMLREWGCNRLIRAFDEIETETGWLSEDLSFCRRHRDSGGTVWAAGHHRITHVGPYGFSGRYLDHHQKGRVHVEFADRSRDAVQADSLSQLPAV